MDGKNARKQTTSLGKTIFAGGIKEWDYENIKKEFNEILNTPWFDEERKKAILERIGEHVGKYPSHELPEDSGAQTGILTSREVDKIIAGYKKAMEYKIFLRFS